MRYEIMIKLLRTLSSDKYDGLEGIKFVVGDESTQILEAENKVLACDTLFQNKFCICLVKVFYRVLRTPVFQNCKDYHHPSETIVCL